MTRNAPGRNPERSLFGLEKLDAPGLPDPRPLQAALKFILIRPITHA